MVLDLGLNIKGNKGFWFLVELQNERTWLVGLWTPTQYSKELGFSNLFVSAPVLWIGAWGIGLDNLHYSVNWGDLFRLDTVHRVVRSVLLFWRVLCFMKDENLLSKFGIGRDMVSESNIKKLLKILCDT